MIILRKLRETIKTWKKHIRHNDEISFKAHASQIFLIKVSDSFHIILSNSLSKQRDIIEIRDIQLKDLIYLTPFTSDAQMIFSTQPPLS